MSSRISLENHMKKLALSWTLAGFALTLGLSLSILLWLPYKDAEIQINNFSHAVSSSYRTEILSGDIRTVELKIQSALNLTGDEVAIFLDPSKQPWIEDTRSLKFRPCESGKGICRDFFQKKVFAYTPIYFDQQKESLWGYLYVEKTPVTDWPLVLSVTLAILVGMTFQGIGFYLSLVRAIKTVSQTLKAWASRLSVNPKNRMNYTEIPFAEIAPIESAFFGLRAEIDQLEEIARKEGALSTLRSVGHDILNPVARIKRILGIVKAEGGTSMVLDQDLYLSLQANIKRLSSYAEQLKFIYKKQVGEESTGNFKTDVSFEVQALSQEMEFDPEVIGRNISIDFELDTNCQVAISSAAIGRLLENLVSNSVQASSQNGTISVTTKSLAHSVIISVTDHGKGISQSIKDKIFEAGVTSRPNQGTGLGLFVVKQICEQYGGRIRLETEIDLGTSFHIEFPKMEVACGLQNSAG